MTAPRDDDPAAEYIRQARAEAGQPEPGPTDDMWAGQDASPARPGGRVLPFPAVREDQDQAAAAPQGPTLADINREFWTARPVLGHIRTCAYAQLASPWAVLGETLARMLTFIPPKVQLPPIIGGPASLNLLVAQVAIAGFGKGAAEATADLAFRFPAEVRAYPLGTGEGLVDTFATTDSQGEQTWHTRAALVSSPEIDHLAAEMGRSSATIGVTVRKAYMGEAQGGAYRTKTSKAYLPKHSYRLTMTIGVQPDRAGTILAEAGGGTPQRFVWLPATDPTCPDIEPALPNPVQWIPARDVALIPFDDDDRPPLFVPVCDEARRIIKEAQRARQREQAVDPMETHSNLTRLKVATALAFLCHDPRDDSMPGVTDEFWDMAGLVMRVSSITRQRVSDALSLAAREQNKGAAYAEASRAEIIADAADGRMQRLTAQRIMKVLGEGDAWQRKGSVSANVTIRLRPYVDETLEALEAKGLIVSRSTTYHGQPGMAYRRADRDER